VFRIYHVTRGGDSAGTVTYVGTVGPEQDLPPSCPRPSIDALAKLEVKVGGGQLTIIHPITTVDISFHIHQLTKGNSCAKVNLVRELQKKV
jgi:hypothetical protein